ncbi:hypothetical protein AWB80_08371 [Caballeronia pedi]|uniref:Uncharacterized protein n=1 Tax=Caballeronia pedi TaxID=1777141 RepID=A0A158E6I3_9BURK|nr:hypothetical protein [Caballeronia pedi]SAL02485.1 hypothetical protein AWB80_08371 [Caballeronia pedi]
MNENDVIDAARAKWNAQADVHNQWDELGCDEKLEWIARVALESVYTQAVEAWMTEDGERVITDATKQKMPRAVQVPYTVPLTRAQSTEKLSEETSKSGEAD